MEGKKPELTVDLLLEEAKSFAEFESTHKETTIYRSTDGKAIGTYLEHKFRKHLAENYTFILGSSASGKDFPGLNVDMKVTSIKQPQSSCPFNSAREKVYGLGYDLLIFVYEKTNEDVGQTSTLNIKHTVFVEAERTGDFQLTRAILNILENEGNEDDLIALMFDKNLPVEEVSAKQLAGDILRQPPTQGYLTISNALQWRLQYTRVIEKAGQVTGVRKVR